MRSVASRANDTEPMLTSSTTVSHQRPSASSLTVMSSGCVGPGAVLGNYHILCGVARGGMAGVWVARKHGARGFSKLIALKTMRPELAADSAFERMFAEEARLAALVRHPNVCEVFDFIELEGMLALAMEWVDGESLARMLAGGKPPLDPRIAARIVAQAAAGLHAAHELRDGEGTPLNLVHRDVSPQNILVSRAGHVKLSDFGIAKAFNGQHETTAAGHVKGKLAYMSPEQALGMSLDRRSDVFALGVVLYCATLGRRPFMLSHERIEVNISRLLRGNFDSPRRVDPEFPPGLAAIIERAMARDPVHRFQTAAELRADLERWLSASGSVVTESDVANALEERCAVSLAKRDASIRIALGLSIPQTFAGSADLAGRDLRSSSAASPVDDVSASGMRVTSLGSWSLPRWALLAGFWLFLAVVLGQLAQPASAPAPNTDSRTHTSVASSAAILAPLPAPPQPTHAAAEKNTRPSSPRATASPLPPSPLRSKSARRRTGGTQATTGTVRREQGEQTPSVAEARRPAKRLGPTEREL